MKKYVIMLVMLFTVSMSSFAEDNNANEAQVTKKYDIKVNHAKLADYLQLSNDQEDAVETISDELSKDMMFAAMECGSSNRVKVTRNVIEKNLKNMSYILTKEQYHKYLGVLNATLNNKGIEY